MDNQNKPQTPEEQLQQAMEELAREITMIKWQTDNALQKLQLLGIVVSQVTQQARSEVAKEEVKNG